MTTKPSLTLRPARKAARSKEATLSLAEARAIALRAQGLGEDSAPFGLGKAGVLDTIRHLGYVQVDTIQVLQRAHHHVLWSRVPDYQPELLHELQSVDASVFEYWNHAASYLPAEDYRYSLSLMRKYRGKLHWADESPDLKKSMRRLLARVRNGGPLRISEVESAGTLASGWSTTAVGKVERRALHEMWMRGDVMIRSRHGFEKVFDLPERVLPGLAEIKSPSKRETAEFHVRRGLRALGIVRPAELHYLQDAARSADVRSVLAGLVQRGEVLEMKIAEEPKDPVFLLPEAMESAQPLGDTPVRFLSPFDNAVIQRKRLRWLFDFDYTVEIYVPAAKRKYGYFVLPILWGDRIIGRMDAKAFRTERQLVIHNLVFEPTFTAWKAIKSAFLEALNTFSHFQQCDRWKITRQEPSSARLPTSGVVRSA